MFAVTMATPIKTITAYRDVLESDANPLIPCPEVHPLESLVPKPTSNPPRNSLHTCTEVVQNPVGESVRV
jgi:hypothetical protein